MSSRRTNLLFSALATMAGAASAHAQSCGAISKLTPMDLTPPPTHAFEVHSELMDEGATADGHGVAGVFTDLNGDGFADQYIPRGHRYLQDKSGAENILRLYEPTMFNFATPSNDPIPDDNGNGIGALAADFDNDGDIDLFVINYNEPNRLYMNQLDPDEAGGEFAFVDVTEEAGVGVAYHEGVCLDNSLTAACADVDRDGDVDIYVSGWNHANGVRLESFVDPPGDGHRGTLWLNQWSEMGGQWETGGPWFIDATMDEGGDFLDADGELFLDADGEPKTDGKALGVTAGSDKDGEHNIFGERYYRRHMATIFADLNNDGWPDLLVTDSFNPQFYRNLGRDGQGWLGFELDTYDTLTNLTTVPGGQGPGLLNAPMGVDAGDVDNDGDLDLYISSSKSEDLLINKSISTALHFDLCESFDAPANANTWGVQIFDVDNDGWKDIHVAAEGTDTLWANYGRALAGDPIEIRGPFQMPLGSEEDMIGTMQADFDRDGKIDLYTRDVGGSSRSSFIWQNVSDTANRSLTFELTGDPTTAGPNGFSSRDALGARVQVDVDANMNFSIEEELGERRMDELHSGSSNSASTSMLAVRIGIGQAADVFVTIFWPSGKLTRFRLYPAGKVTIDGNDGGAGYVSVAEDAPDADGDAVPDEFDNCVNDPNPSQGDSDLDGFGDACDGVGGGGNDCKNSLDLDCDPPPLGATADFDGDGWVDDVDLWVVLSAIEVQGRRGDLNHDGFVDSKDVEIIYAQWGKVPEEESK